MGVQAAERVSVASTRKLMSLAAMFRVKVKVGALKAGAGLLV
jgi:hypothetical protein